MYLTVNVKNIAKLFNVFGIFLVTSILIVDLFDDWHWKVRLSLMVSKGTELEKVVNMRLRDSSKW